LTLASRRSIHSVAKTSSNPLKTAPAQRRLNPVFRGQRSLFAPQTFTGFLRRFALEMRARILCGEKHSMGPIGAKWDINAGPGTIKPNAFQSMHFFIIRGISVLTYRIY
jgi:hypothetical protein